MTDTRFDVLAIGNAIVDVLAKSDEALLDQFGLVKGDMTLVDATRASALYDAMGPAREISGGSAANTLAGIAALGKKCAFIGQVANDQLGEVFTHDIVAAGVDFDVPAREGEPPTGRCLILVTPDGQRTMNTFLGAAHYLPETAADAELVGSSTYLYLEGYMWDPPEPRRAILRAISAARAAGRQIALTLSVTFFIEQYRHDFLRLIDDGLIDILFCNGEEAACLLEMNSPAEAEIALSKRVETLIVTHGEQGASGFQNGVRTDVPAEPVVSVVDTTGAGDLFAAGFLTGCIDGRPMADCLTMGAVCAAEIISHYGARPEADIAELVRVRLARTS